MRAASNTPNPRLRQVGLTMVLIGSVCGAIFMPGPARLASAQAVSPSWSFTGSLNTARTNHTATLLKNGKVLVVGGQGNSGLRNSAEVYDPSSGIWSIVGNINTARSDHTATLLPNGKVLVAGGLSSNNQSSTSLNSAELYDPATGIWSSTGSLNIARGSHTATLLSTGKVLVTGGFDPNLNSSNTAELYDPATGVWSSTGNLNEARESHTETRLPNGKVLVVGGYSCIFFGDFCVILNSAELYDPATGTWSSTGTLSAVAASHTATLLPSGKVLVAGGFDDGNYNRSNRAELYNPATGTWSSTGNLNSGRAGHTATLLSNGKVLIASGFGVDFLKTAELYEPATGLWSSTANLDSFRTGHTATLLPNGRVLVAGGNDYGNNAAELYDPGTSPIPNQIDDAQFFVRQHYRDFLNREPDPGGLDFWTNKITSCGFDTHCVEVKRIDTSAAFFLSIEFQETGYLVYRIYKSAYGNLPGTPVPVRLNEFLPDTQQIGQGIVVGVGNWEAQLEVNKQTFAADFVSRSRFSTDYPLSMTPAEFVDTFLINAGFSPPVSERAALINEFGSAATSEDSAARARVLRRVAENPTLKQQEFNRAFVLIQYFGYLRRNPNDPPELTLDFQGYNFWLNKLNQFNGNFVNADMVKAFLVSAEYRQRFAQP